MGLNSAHKFCLGMIIVGILLLLVGSAAPFWLKSFQVTYGLWFGCVQGVCALYNWGNFTWDYYSIWFYLVHGLAGLSTLIACVMLFASCCALCGERDSVTTTAVVVLICGLLGVTGSGMFWAKPFESFHILALDRDWAFYLFGAGSIITTLFSIILLIIPGSKNNTVNPY